MLTLYIADAERGVGMKNLSQKEAIALLRNLEDSLDSYCELNEEGKTAFRMAIEALSCSEFPNSSDTMSRQAAIDIIEAGRLTKLIDAETVVNGLKGLPSAQPEEAIPVSWIEAIIERFMMTGDAFSGLTASIIRVMLNEWKREQEGDTT